MAKRRNTLLYLEDRSVGNELEGQPPESWVRREKPEWFSVEPLSGQEYMQAQQMQSTVSHRLTSDYLPNCNARMRLTAGHDGNNPTRTFNVESVVNPNDQNKSLEWMAKEVT